MHSADTSTARWIRDHVPKFSVMLIHIFRYVLTLLPLPFWILSYNGLWLWEDAVAEIAQSLVVIPQSIAFGIMSQISPMHGLYSTFAGLILY
jgi:MFS superfamily sulfate permease-like transporter